MWLAVGSKLERFKLKASLENNQLLGSRQHADWRGLKLTRSCDSHVGIRLRHVSIHSEARLFQQESCSFRMIPESNDSTRTHQHKRIGSTRVSLPDAITAMFKWETHLSFDKLLKFIFFFQLYVLYIKCNTFAYGGAHQLTLQCQHADWTNNAPKWNQVELHRVRFVLLMALGWCSSKRFWCLSSGPGRTIQRL